MRADVSASLAMRWAIFLSTDTLARMVELGTVKTDVNVSDGKGKKLSPSNHAEYSKSDLELNDSFSPTGNQCMRTSAE
jgi:hypothetical protein